MGNPFVHIELNSTDQAAARAFYGQLFDWEMKDMPLPGSSPDAGEIYTTIAVGGGTGGGIMRQMMPNTPSFWLPYALVKDIHAATSKAASLGAVVMKDVSEVPGMGFLSIIKDPTGAVLGLWQFTNP
jgi:predicted enzyme related to lactoylglutathione lyase